MRLRPIPFTSFPAHYYLGFSQFSYSPS